MKEGMRKATLSLVVTVLASSVFATILHAQTPAEKITNSSTEAKTDTVASTLGANNKISSGPLPPEVLILKKIEDDLKEKYKKEIYIPPSIPSLVFTPTQQSLLREARNGFNTKIPTEIEKTVGYGNGDLELDLDLDLQKPVGTSVGSLSLGGIVFLSPDEWTIWLNKKRVTPDRIPAEAIDLRVYKDFIELRWFDSKSNQIYPIRLRPNQTFSLDAHAFVPG